MLPQKITPLLREAGWIAALAAIAFVGVALMSYSANDPLHAPGDIANLGGRVGAWMADFLFVWFGRMAYLLLALAAFLCLLSGWRIRHGIALAANISHMPGTLERALLPGGLALMMSGGCVLEQMYFPLPGAIRAGGLLGYYLAPPLSAYFGMVGASLVALTFFISGVTFAARVSWFAVMDSIGFAVFAAAAVLHALAEKLMDRREGVRARKQRRVNVQKFRDELSEQPPPKIAPKITAAPESERKRAERQGNVFGQNIRGKISDGAETPLPPLSLLEPPGAHASGYSRDALASMSQLLVKKLKDFNVEIAVEAVQPGPVITRFEVEPAPGVKASQIVGLARDLARSLSVESVRVVDNIAGKTVIGIEIPNQNRELVQLVEGLSSREYEESASPLTLVLGKDIAGNPVITDLQRMPHVLIAGTTGSGKSVCVNALILSVLYKSTPQQVRMIMVDPKFLELSVYGDIPHLLTPVVTDMNLAANALRWCIKEMDRRFRLMAAIGVRNIGGYNKKVAAAVEAGTPLADPFADGVGESGGGVGESDDGFGGDGDGDGDGETSPPTLQELPYILVVVDELADLMMVVGKKIEEIIIRIAQRARAAGIHLILATQRPSVDVVTGLIKANVPTRIAFQVSSRADSRTVLDQMGAEQLLGEGDMLFMPPGVGQLQRVHGSFVSDEEVLRVVATLKESGPPVYLEQVTSAESGDGGVGGGVDGGGDGGESDPLYDQAVQFVTQSRRASISSVQRALRVGYNRAARMIESMEESGVISASENGKREVLAPPPPAA